MLPLDLGTRKFWRAVGRPIDVSGPQDWLRAPVSAGVTVADGWLAAEAELAGGRVVEGEDGAGLLPDLAVLDGPGFAAADVHPRIRAFYEHSSDWRMEVWAGWSPVFWLGGEVVSRLFGKRVQQLALPMRPLDVAHGMDSRVSVIHDAAGRQVAAGWIRTLRSTGEVVFSGCYSARRLPGSDRASVHVAFPLESGNVQVYLRPDHGPDRSLLLRSPRGRFGQDGAYVVVEDGGRTYAARVPVHETFHVYVDEEGILRADHHLRIWNATAVRLHYRLDELD
ncbi:hypothetical protein [Nocardioides limicola]|uniref:hypothetical protein n=1 Tax=Nocardioides limicola TaxID=2803368 RepID=UPI0027DC290C|nr:hypothetical protein [Nocardioides sp. DJM-14]